MLLHVFEKLKNEIQNFIARFCFYLNMKNEIQNFIARFCFYLNMKNEIQVFDYHYHVYHVYFEFLIPSLVFHFHRKNGKRNTVRFLFFILMKELKNELLKQIKINFIIIFTSIVCTLFKSNFVSSPLRFSTV